MKCPTCGSTLPPPKKGAPLPSTYPFCSVRCKMIDLGHWFNEDYRVSRPLEEDEDVPLPPPHGD